MFGGRKKFDVRLEPRLFNQLTIYFSVDRIRRIEMIEPETEPNKQRFFPVVLKKNPRKSSKMGHKYCIKRVVIIGISGPENICFGRGKAEIRYLLGFSRVP